MDILSAIKREERKLEKAGRITSAQTKRHKGGSRSYGTVC